jgi:HK97 family phage major capsid protein
MEDKDGLEKQLKELKEMLAEQYKVGEEQQRKHGTILEDTVVKMTALQKQVDAIDINLAKKFSHDEDPAEDGIEKVMKESDSLARLMKEHRGSAVLQFKGNQMNHFLGRKTTITSGTVGVATTGVLQIDRIPGITAEARQQLKVRDLLSASPTTMQVVDFVKVSQPLTVGSPVPEASTKPENQLNFQSVSEKVRLLATWIPATRQIIDDMTELMGFINSSMPYYVNLGEEIQLLSGDGTGENLHGLIPQATPFQGSLLVGPSNSIDYVGRAIEQIGQNKELDPTFVILHPNNWWNMRLLKDSFGRYILGDPQTNVRPSLFGLDVVYTTSIAFNQFLVGSGSPIAAEIRDRMEMQVEISTEHSTYFVQNMVAVRAEKRLVLLVKRPASFVTGSFAAASPA